MAEMENVPSAVRQSFYDNLRERLAKEPGVCDLHLEVFVASLHVPPPDKPVLVQRIKRLLAAERDEATAAAEVMRAAVRYRVHPGFEELLRERVRHLFPHIDRYIAGNQILDVRTGTGQFVTDLWAHRSERRATNVTQYDVRDGRSRSPAFQEFPMIHSLEGLGNDAFDTATAISVFSRMSREERMLESEHVRRVARRLFVLDSVTGLSNQTQTMFADWLYQSLRASMTPLVQWFPTADELRAFFEERGWRVAHDDGNGELALDLGFMLPIPKGYQIYVFERA